MWQNRLTIAQLQKTIITYLVSSYVEAKDNREVINIAELNEEISLTVEKINKLCVDIDAIIKEIEA